MLNRPVSITDKILKAIVTGFYLGSMPFVPGTFGTLGGVLIYLLIVQFCSGNLINLLLGIGIVVFTILSIALGPWDERYFNKKDPHPFVLDEIAGFLVACLFIKPMLMPVAFVLFRIFDIVKPFPAKRSQVLTGGVGIVIDDLIAGLYANGCIQIISLYVLNN